MPCSVDLINGWAIASVTGIVAAAALSLRGRYFFRTLSVRIHVTIFAGIIILAMAGLLAWQKQHSKSIQAENLAALNSFNSEANQLFEESLTINNGPDYSAFLTKVDELYDRLERWVANHMGARTSEFLVRGHPIGDVNIAVGRAIDSDYRSAAMIMQTRETIQALIDAKGLDECVQPMTAEHPTLQLELIPLKRNRGWLK